MTEHEKPREWVLISARDGSLGAVHSGLQLVPDGGNTDARVRVVEAEPVERELERVYADQQLKWSQIDDLEREREVILDLLEGGWRGITTDLAQATEILLRRHGRLP